MTKVIEGQNQGRAFKTEGPVKKVCELSLGSSWERSWGGLGCEGG